MCKNPDFEMKFPLICVTKTSQLAASFDNVITSAVLINEMLWGQVALASKEDAKIVGKIPRELNVSHAHAAVSLGLFGAFDHIGLVEIVHSGAKHER